MTVLFGASSVGKTALLREVLSDVKYGVLSFDFRISGVGDLESCWFGLSFQMVSLILLFIYLFLGGREGSANVVFLFVGGRKDISLIYLN